MSLSEKQEKALLEFMQSIAAHHVALQFGGPLGAAARAYLASLEPKYDNVTFTNVVCSAKPEPAKPEPKRGVEDLIHLLFDNVGMLPERKRLVEEALCLYREERERVQKVVANMHSYSAAKHHPHPETVRRWERELERRDG